MQPVSHVNEELELGGIEHETSVDDNSQPLFLDEIETENTFLNMPEEVIVSVLISCNHRKTILSFLSTCKDINLSSEDYFKRIVKGLHGKESSLIFPDVTWRWLYDSKENIVRDEEVSFTGVGKRFLFQNDVYEGEFLEDKLHRKGTYYWIRGDKYIGEWKNGLQDGVGTLIWKGAGNKYVGEWMGGLRHGKGVYSWEVKGFNCQEGLSRDCFEGTWVNGKRQGPGKYKWANGNYCEGIWNSDTRVGGHFYEKLTDRLFYAPNVDNEGEALNIKNCSEKIQEAYNDSKCTYFATGNDYYFQYLWETTHEMPYNGVCLTCKEMCVERNQIPLSNPVKFIFGGKFICSCGAGFYKHPCRAMGLFDPQHR